MTSAWGGKTVGRDPALDLMLELDNALGHVLAMGRSWDLALDRDLDLAHIRVRSLLLGRALPFGLGRALDCANTLDRALTDVLDRAFTDAGYRTSAVVTANAFAKARDRALDLVTYLERLEAPPRVRAGERRAEVRVAPAAGRLLAAATRLLPAQDRARYAEEFRGELWEIARAAGGRRPQLAYAARQVMAAPRLRARLRVPRRRGAVL